MNSPSIDLLVDRVYDARSRALVKEVYESFVAGHYRATLVLLWTAVVCDILYKLQELRDLYGDTAAENLLKEVEAKQLANPKSPEWERFLVEEAAKRTSLLDNVELLFVQEAQSYRNLSAHPVFGRVDLLYTPNAETARACIINMLEAVLLKPPVLSKKIVSALVDDLASKKALLVGDEELRRYLRARYFVNLRPETENELFRALWKFVFSLSNSDVDANREINARALSMLYEVHPRQFEDYVAANQQVFSHILDGIPLEHLVRFLSKHPRFYGILGDGAKAPIDALLEQDPDMDAMAWFKSQGLSAHLVYLQDRLVKEYRAISMKSFNELVAVAGPEGCMPKMIDLGISLYCASTDFQDADKHFANCAAPFLRDFSREQCIDLLQGIENNNQTYWRGRARADHAKVKEAFEDKLGSEFDYAAYPSFSRSVANRTP